MAALFMRTQEVAGTLGISQRRVQLLCRNDTLPAKKLGKTWLIDRAAFAAFIKPYKDKRHRVHVGLCESPPLHVFPAGRPSVCVQKKIKEMLREIT